MYGQQGHSDQAPPITPTDVARPPPVTSASLTQRRGTSRRRDVTLLADSEPKDGDGTRTLAADRVQVDPEAARGRERDAVAEHYWQEVHEDLVDEPTPERLGGHVGAEDLQVLAACGLQGRGDRLSDVAG